MAVSDVFEETLEGFTRHISSFKWIPGAFQGNLRGIKKIQGSLKGSRGGSLKGFKEFFENVLGDFW